MTKIDTTISHISTWPVHRQSERYERAHPDARDYQMLEQECEYYRDLFIHAPDSYLLTDLRGNIQDANLAAAQMLGTPRDQLVGQSLYHFLGKPETTELHHILQQLQHGEQRVQWDVVLKPPHQSALPAELHIGTTTDCTGQAVGARWLVRNTTRYRQAEESLRKAEHFTRSILDSLAANIAVLDENGTIIRVNETWRAFARDNARDGVPMAEGANYLTVCDTATGSNAEEAAPFAAAIRAALAGREDVPLAVEYPCHSPEKERWFVGGVARLINHEPPGVVVAHADITQRKRVEAALKASEERLRRLVELSPATIAVSSADGSLLYVNPAGARMMGPALPHELIGQSIWRWIHSDDQAAIRHILHQKPAADEQTTLIKQRLLRFDGQIIHTEVAPIAMTYNDQPATLIVMLDVTEHKEMETLLEQRVVERTAQLEAANRALQREIAERRQAEQQLFASEKRYRTLVEASPSAIVLTDTAMIIQFCNHQAAQLFGYGTTDELVGKQAADLFAAGACPFSPEQMMAETDGIMHMECMMCRQDGRQFPADISSSVAPGAPGTAAALTLVMYDLSQQKEIQARLIDYERFAASAKLSATVAHEVNSPLQTIQSILEVVDQISQDERDQMLMLAHTEIERITQIVRQLLDIYRPEAKSPGFLDVNALIKRVLMLNSLALAKSGVWLEQMLSPDIPSFWGCADHLTQVLINLFFNALDAMPNGGTLRIETAVLKPEATIQIIIQDTGTGVSPDIQHRIFEPFFTTHPGGTGLGLSISQEIVATYGGHITMQSNVGAGSTFTIDLPLHIQWEDAYASAHLAG